MARGPCALTDPDTLADPAVAAPSLSVAPSLPPESAGALLPSVRDAVFRRLLGIADLGAAAGGLFIAGALRGHAASVVAALTIPMIVLIAKMTGRYDHDEVVLRKSVKRGMDVLGAAFGVLVLAPLGAVVAVLIKLHSPGPVFFRQQRVGRDGRTFAMIEFRSMVAGAEAQRAALELRNETSGLFKLSDDPRVTRVGRVLRRTSIDELPQLFNVLRGDTSLVGPRPLVVDGDRLVSGRHRDRLQFAPGMTGPWQVLGPKRPPLSEMVKSDLLYAANWSLWTDIKILVRTHSRT